MKNRLKDFVVNKKDLIVFLGLIVVTFITVIAIAQVTLQEDKVVVETPDVEDNNDDSDDTTVSPDVEPEVEYYISTPYSGNKTIVRDFYNFDEPGTNQNAVIVTASGTYLTSQGVGFANDDNSVFNVQAIYKGTIIDVTEDDVLGASVTIKHSNDLVSVYSSLSSVDVAVGDEVDTNTILGIAGESSFDLLAGVHVHVEVYKVDSNKYFDITTIIGKTIDEVVSSIK